MLHPAPVVQLSAVQFHLITTTALFISREGFRRGCLRFGGSIGSGSSAENKDDAGQAPTRGTETSGKVATVAKANAAAGGEGGGVDNMSVLRVAWLVVPLGLLVTAAVCGVAVRQQPATGANGGAVPYYREAVVLHGMRGNGRMWAGVYLRPCLRVHRVAGVNGELAPAGWQYS